MCIFIIVVFLTFEENNYTEDIQIKSLGLCLGLSHITFRKEGMDTVGNTSQQLVLQNDFDTTGTKNDPHSIYLYVVDVLTGVDKTEFGESRFYTQVVISTTLVLSGLV